MIADEAWGVFTSLAHHLLLSLDPVHFNGHATLLVRILKHHAIRTVLRVSSLVSVFQSSRNV